MRRIINVIKRPSRLILHLNEYRIFRLMPDEAYLKLIYRCEMGRKLNLTSPNTYNEKLQWLKLKDRRPEYKTYADKYAVREYLRQTVGEDYLIPLIAVYDRVDEIEWDALPAQFVLKCTHASGTNIICTDKNRLDIETAKRQLNRWMQRDYYWHGREWQYKNMRPRIICEKYLADESDFELKDYKFHCFNGEPKIATVVLNRFQEGGPNGNFYDMAWNLLPFYQHYPPSTSNVPKPKNFEKMKEIACKISEGLLYIRIDYYEAAGQLYMGELTLHPASGWLGFIPESADGLVGSWLELPQ